MATQDVSVAFRTTDIVEVYSFNERQRGEAETQTALVEANSIHLSTMRALGHSVPSKVILAQSFPLHALSDVHCCHDKYMWGSALQAVSLMSIVNPDKLTDTLSMMFTEETPLPLAFMPRDAIAACIVAGLLVSYAETERVEATPDIFASRASVLELAKPFDGSITPLGPSDEEIIDLDGDGSLSTSSGLRAAKAIFGGAYLAWISDAPDAQMELWRSAVVDLLDLLPMPSGSLANGYADRRRLRHARENGRLVLPSKFAPRFRGANLCTQENALSVLCTYGDRILAQPDGRTMENEFAIGRQRTGLLERLHPVAKNRVRTALVAVATERLFDDLPELDLAKEMRMHGWLAAFRYARKTKAPIHFDDSLFVSKVGSAEWSSEVAGSTECILDRYTLFIILTLLFDCDVKNADRELRAIIEKCPRPYRELKLVIPEEGVRPEVKFASTFLIY